jgi:outer membrane protein
MTQCRQVTIWAATLVLVAASSRAADMKVAVVDMQRALNECAAGKQAMEQVKAKADKAQDQLKRQRDELDRARAEFEKKALVLREEQQRDLEKEFGEKQLDLKRKIEDVQRDLKRTTDELTSGIVEQLYGVVAEVAQQKGYQVVIQSSFGGAVIYNDKSVDITDDVIKQHDANPSKARSGGKRPGGTDGGE